MKEVNPNTPLTDAARSEIAELAQKQYSAQGVLMRIISVMGGKVEVGIAAMPAPVRKQVEAAARIALRQSYHLAARSWDHQGLRRMLASDRAHHVAATVTGAIGGAGGMLTATAEIPLATTMIFRAIQGVAETHGEDPSTDDIRMECLCVFGAGAPGQGDDGIDTAFIGARIGLTGTAVQGIIARVAPRFAAVLGQKLASQAVPVLGAVAGAGTNYAFVRYYTEIAHVHFGLRRLIRTYGKDQVLREFHSELAKLTRPLTVFSGR